MSHKNKLIQEGTGSSFLSSDWSGGALNWTQGKLGMLDIPTKYYKTEIAYLRYSETKPSFFLTQEQHKLLKMALWKSVKIIHKV